jgi:hypothetical protein
MAKIALAKQDSGDPFYTAKLATARFYFAKLLPETAGLIRSARAGVAAAWLLAATPVRPIASVPSRQTPSWFAHSIRAMTSARARPSTSVCIKRLRMVALLPIRTSLLLLWTYPLLQLPSLRSPLSVVPR